MVENIKLAIDNMGFSDFSFSQLSEKALFGGKILTTRSDLLALYKDQKFFRHDLVLQHAKKSTSPIFLSTVERYLKCAPFDAELVRCNLRISEFYKKYGYSDLYCIPFDIDTRGKKRVLFSIACQGEKQACFQNRIKKMAPTLQLLAEFIGFVCSVRFADTLLTGSATNEVVITPKPLRLLEVLAKQNVTLKDAAAILCITLNTANKHIAAAKQALGANTQGAAVYRAIKEGIIDT